MGTKKRLTGEERRTAIIEAVIPIFAREGFAGATTKQLAAAAGVSEALLYKHFPSKESLSEAMHLQCLSRHAGLLKQLSELPPCTENLVFCIWIFATHIVFAEELSKDLLDKMFPRLMIQSVLGDGEFARSFMQRGEVIWWRKATDCLRTAREAGDVPNASGNDKLDIWFAHHIGVTINMLRLPDNVLVDYELSKKEVRDSLVRFSLQGMGMAPDVVTKFYDPDRLEAQYPLPQSPDASK